MIKSDFTRNVNTSRDEFYPENEAFEARKENTN